MADYDVAILDSIRAEETAVAGNSFPDGPEGTRGAGAVVCILIIVFV